MGCGASVHRRYKAPSQGEIIHFLRKVPLFKQLPEDQFPLLAGACKVKFFDAGEIVIREGDVGKEFYIIREGEASVRMGDNDELSAAVHRPSGNLKTCDYFGERALLDDILRTATIIAETDLSVLLISREKFKELGLSEKLQFRHRRASRRKSRTKVPLPKKPHERIFIGEALKQNENLKAMVELNEHKLTAMADACWREAVKEGRQIIRQGDGDADHFFIIEDGQFEVSAEMEDGDPEAQKRWATKNSRLPRRLGPGSSFGELAILCLAPRSATVTALTKATVWVLDRENFRRLLVANTEAQTQQQMQYLGSVDVLKALAPYEWREMAAAFTEFRYEQGEFIVEEGKPATAFYVMVEGEVAIYRDGQESRRLCGSVKEKRAPYFGEIALLNREQHSHSIRVASPFAQVLALDANSFYTYLEPLQDVMKQARRPSRCVRTQRSSLSMSSVPSERAILREDLVHKQLIGAGSMATVGLCQHSATKKVYALKSMSKGHIVKLGMQGRVMSEKAVLWMSKSPFIVRLHSTYNTPQNLELLLEAGLGGDLRELYKRRELHGSKTHAVFYSAGVICAFVHLHELWVIHRDLRPENVVLNSHGHPKLADMGLAKVTPGVTYTVCGMPDYFAPEMVRQTGHSSALDWWTLGVFIFELLAGDLPFKGLHPMEVYRNICSGIDKVQFPPSCRSSASSLIKGLLVQEPRQRLPIKEGLRDLEKHPFYQGLSWDAFRDLKVGPPFVPALSSPLDTRHFKLDASKLPPRVPYTDDGSGWDYDFESHAAESLMHQWPEAVVPRSRMTSKGSLRLPSLS